MSVKRVVKGFAIGAALGAIAGILFAPQTGKQTQKVVKAKIHTIKGIVAAKAAGLKKLSAEAYEKLVEEAVELARGQKMTMKEIASLKKELLAKYKEIKKELS